MIGPIPMNAIALKGRDFSPAAYVRVQSAALAAEGALATEVRP